MISILMIFYILFLCTLLNKCFLSKYKRSVISLPIPLDVKLCYAVFEIVCRGCAPTRGYVMKLQRLTRVRTRRMLASDSDYRRLQRARSGWPISPQVTVRTVWVIIWLKCNFYLIMLGMFQCFCIHIFFGAINKILRFVNKSLWRLFTKKVCVVKSCV